MEVRLASVCALLCMIPAVVLARGHMDRKVNFGVNGHPLNNGSYAGSLEQQVADLKKLGLRTYRVNVNPSDPDKYQRLSQLIAIAEKAGIRILPTIIMKAQGYSDENIAHDDAREKTYALVKQFGTHVKVWELGNEYDLYCLQQGSSGASPGDYDTTRYDMVRALLTGMLQGLHEADPSARSMVNTAKSNQYPVDSGFLQRLIDDGVRFDIVSYHYYDQDGHVPTTNDGTRVSALQILHDGFHKPIWITEFDRSSSGPDIGPSADPKAQGQALTRGMREIAADAAEYDVANADIYELLNQPELLKQPGIKPNQAGFGILGPDGTLTAASRAVRAFLRSYR